MYFTYILFFVKTRSICNDYRLINVVVVVGGGVVVVVVFAVVDDDDVYETGTWPVGRIGDCMYSYSRKGDYCTYLTNKYTQ